MRALEKHYTVQEVAAKWGFSDDTIRRMFRREPGVLAIGKGERRFKRAYVSLSIPETVLTRVYNRLAIS